jgi:hypothetical protein
LGAIMLRVHIGFFLKKKVLSEPSAKCPRVFSFLVKHNETSTLIIMITMTTKTRTQ